MLAGDLGERGLLLQVQVWAKASDLGAVKSELIGRIQLSLDEAGVRLVGLSQPIVRWSGEAPLPAPGRDDDG